MKVLTNHQQNVYDDIKRDIIDIYNGDSWSTPFIDLQGYAGVGKTFIISMLVEDLLRDGLRIEITTPTHKSLQVAKHMLNNTINVRFNTIHSRLKLKQVPSNNPNVDYILKMDTQAKLQRKVDLLIIDESSMVSDEIMKYIYQHVEDGLAGIVLFVGDPAQLLPVDGDKNPIYSNKDIKHYKLTEVVRQAKDNPIIGIATTIREAIDKNVEIDIPSLFKEESKVIVKFNNMQDWMKSYLMNPYDYEEKQLIAYTNKTVDAYSNFVRSYIHKSNTLPYIMDNEKVIIQSAVVRENEILYRNGDEVNVRNPRKLKEEGMNIWSYNGINTVDPDSLERYNLIKSTLKDAAIKTPKEWYKYYKFLEKYTEIKRIYACTIHKAQGSGWNAVYFNLSETLQYLPFSDRNTIYRLIYVALTRVIDDLYVLI